MQKQTRRLQGYINPDIVPVDQDQWDRLKSDIESIPPISEKYGNMKWAIIGFCGSLILSNAFYIFSPNSNLTIVYISSALLIGFLLCVLILSNIVREDKNSHIYHISRCKDTLSAIERRVRAEQAEMITTAIPEDFSDTIQKTGERKETINDSPITKKDVKDILTKLNQTARKG